MIRGVAFRVGLLLIIFGSSVAMAKSLPMFAGETTITCSTPAPPGGILTMVYYFGFSEVRIIVEGPSDFRGVLMVLDFDGIRLLLSNGSFDPLISEGVNRSLAVTFHPPRRELYAVSLNIIHIRPGAWVSVKVVGRGYGDDLLLDCHIPIAVGVALATVARLSRLRKAAK